MADWMGRKASIEGEFKRKVDAAADVLAARMEAADDLRGDLRAKERGEAMEDYRAVRDAAAERAAEREAAMFGEMREALRAAYSKPPTAEQAAVLQALSMTSKPTAAQVRSAAEAVAGNPIAEAAVSSAADAAGVPFSAGAAPDLDGLLVGVSRFEEQRKESVAKYRKNPLAGFDAHAMAFDPEGSSNGFDAALGAAERYGA